MQGLRFSSQARARMPIADSDGIDGLVLRCIDPPPSHLRSLSGRPQSRERTRAASLVVACIRGEAPAGLMTPEGGARRKAVARADAEGARPRTTRSCSDTGS